MWRAECFGFDERVALEHGVRQGHHGLCVRCGHPVRIGDELDDGVFLRRVPHRDACGRRGLIGKSGVALIDAINTGSLLSRGVIPRRPIEALGCPKFKGFSPLTLPLVELIQPTIVACN